MEKNIKKINKNWSTIILPIIKKQKKKINDIEKGQLKILKEYFEIIQTYTNIENCIIYMNEFPKNNKIYKHDHIKFIFSVYLNQIYKFRLRIESFYKKLERVIKKYNKKEDILKDYDNNIKKSTKKEKSK